MFDSHCHLAGDEFSSDLGDVVGRAKDAGVSGALVILGAEDVAELGRAANVAGAWDQVRFSVGVHPHQAGQFASDPPQAARQAQAAIDAQPLSRAVGEIGLDYHYDFAPRDVQQQVFREQIRLAGRLSLPIVIHTREAEEDTFRILEEEHARDIGGVFHCFTGDREMAKRCLDIGFYLSLAGIVTFPRALELKEVARWCRSSGCSSKPTAPSSRRFRIGGNETSPPMWLRVAEVIAGLRGTTAEAIADATHQNHVRLFAP
jgi:TatD DNase family protein